MKDRVKIFFDGGCRGMDGRLEIAVVARGRTWIVSDLGHGTSADAEWLALIHAATIARTMTAARIVLLGDSADIVAKAGARLRCDDGARHHLDRFRALFADGATPAVRHIKRSQNLAGIALERLRRD